MTSSSNPIRCLFRNLYTAAKIAVHSPPVSKWKPLHLRLLTLGGAPEGTAALTVDKWVMEGRKVTAPQLMQSVRTLRKFRRHKQALEVMDWMERKGLEMPNGGHAVRINLISQVKGIDSAEEYFSSLSEPDKQQQTYGALLNCYCMLKMPEKAITLYEKMKELNLTSNTLAYNNIMSLYMNSGQHEKVPKLFEDMKRSNIVSDNITYRILIKCYASINDIGSMERAIQDMEGSQVPLDWKTYCQLADIYNSAGLFEKAEIALKKAELVMNSRDLSPFPLLISLYAGAGNLAEVKQVWKLLKDRTTRPSTKHYSVMLQALDKLDDINALNHCYKEWESGCDNYDIRVVNVMIGAYLRRNMVRVATLLREKAEEKCTWSNIQTFELFRDYYLKHHELEMAQKFSEAATSAIKRGRLDALEADIEF